MTESHFQYGDHLMVRRTGYDHHGIYISDARVIDFGGYDLRAKHRNGIRPVTLKQFAGNQNAEAVRHPSAGRIFGPKWLPEPLPPDQIVAEAERLAEIGFVGRYTLFGSNCEHVANWCVTGNYFESLQTKKFATMRIVAISLWMLLHRSKGDTKWWRLTCWALVLISAAASYQRERAPYKFWEGIERRPSPPLK